MYFLHLFSGVPAQREKQADDYQSFLINSHTSLWLAAHVTCLMISLERAIVAQNSQITSKVTLRKPLRDMMEYIDGLSPALREHLKMN